MSSNRADLLAPITVANDELTNLFRSAAAIQKQLISKLNALSWKNEKNIEESIFAANQIKKKIKTESDLFHFIGAYEFILNSSRYSDKFKKGFIQCKSSFVELKSAIDKITKNRNDEINFKLTLLRHWFANADERLAIDSIVLSKASKDVNMIPTYNFHKHQKDIVINKLKAKYPNLAQVDADLEDKIWSVAANDYVKKENDKKLNDTKSELEVIAESLKADLIKLEMQRLEQAIKKDYSKYLLKNIDLSRTISSFVMNELIKYYKDDLIHAERLMMLKWYVHAPAIRKAIFEPFLKQESSDANSNFCGTAMREVCSYMAGHEHLYMGTAKDDDEEYEIDLMASDEELTALDVIPNITRPILIKKDKQFYIYGYTDGQWKLTSLTDRNSTLANICFPVKNEQGFSFRRLEKSEIPSMMYQIIKESKGMNSLEYKQMLFQASCEQKEELGDWLNTLPDGIIIEDQLANARDHLGDYFSKILNSLAMVPRITDEVIQDKNYVPKEGEQEVVTLVKHALFCIRRMELMEEHNLNEKQANSWMTSPIIATLFLQMTELVRTGKLNISSFISFSAYVLNLSEHEAGNLFYQYTQTVAYKLHDNFMQNYMTSLAANSLTMFTKSNVAVDIKDSEKSNDAGIATSMPGNEKYEADERLKKRLLFSYAGSKGLPFEASTSVSNMETITSRSNVGNNRR